MNKMKKAFTIVEIVVAMLVLGGIAMILMPVLYNDTGDKINETALNKTYSNLQQTANSIGLLISTGKISQTSSPAFTFFQALTATSKTVNAMDLSVAGNFNEAGNDHNNIKAKFDAYLADYDPENNVTGIIPSYSNTVVLKNGVFVMLSNDNTYIVVDVNGKRTPNKVGKDIFYFDVNGSDRAGRNTYSIRPSTAGNGNCNYASDNLADRIGCTGKSLKIKL